MFKNTHTSSYIYSILQSSTTLHNYTLVWDPIGFISLYVQHNNKITFQQDETPPKRQQQHMSHIVTQCTCFSQTHYKLQWTPCMELYQYSLHAKQLASGGIPPILWIKCQNSPLSNCPSPVLSLNWTDTQSIKALMTISAHFCYEDITTQKMMHAANQLAQGRCAQPL